MKFESFHPGINLFYFTIVFICGGFFNHPVYILSLLVCGIIYSCLLLGKKAVFLDFLLFIFIIGYTFYFSYYNHFGVTDLGTNIIGNKITFESVFYGAFMGIKTAGMILFLVCFFSVFKTDKVVYLLGRVSPKMSLFLAVCLRSFPRIINRAETLKEGLFCQGKKLTVTGVFSFISGLVTWTLEDYMESATSMHSRGYLMPKRTSFSIYRFDNRDRFLVILMGIGTAFLWMANSLGKTKIQYNPIIVINKMTTLDMFFALVYTLFLLIPVIIYVFYEVRFIYCIRSHYE